MKARLFIIIAIGLSFIISILYDSFSTPTEMPQVAPVQQKISQGQALPLLALTTVEGEELDLSAYHGKIILLNFWASWCAPCLQEFPAMITLTEQFKDQVILIAVSKDDKKQDIDKFLRKFPRYKSPSIKIVWDKNKSISEQTFNTLKVPETIVINKNTRMVRKIVGNSSIWHDGEMKKYLEKLLKQP